MRHVQGLTRCKSALLTKASLSHVRCLLPLTGLTILTSLPAAADKTDKTDKTDCCR